MNYERFHWQWKRIWTSTKPRPLERDNYHFFWLDLVNINVNTKSGLLRSSDRHLFFHKYWTRLCFKRWKMAFGSPMGKILEAWTYLKFHAAIYTVHVLWLIRTEGLTRRMTVVYTPKVPPSAILYMHRVIKAMSHGLWSRLPKRWSVKPSRNPCFYLFRLSTCTVKFPY